MTPPAGLHTRYLPGCSVAHYVDADNHNPRAVCGVCPVDFWYWRGSGCQREIDRVASLRLCRRCVQAQEREWSR